MADAKLGASQNGPFHYPDVMVSCDPRDQRARKVIYHPCLIVEILYENVVFPEDNSEDNPDE